MFGVRIEYRKTKKLRYLSNDFSKADLHTMYVQEFNFSALIRMAEWPMLITKYVCKCICVT